jgi:hypothetical protein
MTAAPLVSPAAFLQHFSFQAHTRSPEELVNLESQFMDKLSDWLSTNRNSLLTTLLHLHKSIADPETPPGELSCLLRDADGITEKVLNDPAVITHICTLIDEIYFSSSFYNAGIQFVDGSQYYKDKSSYDTSRFSNTHRALNRLNNDNTPSTSSNFSSSPISMFIGTDSSGSRPAATFVARFVKDPPQSQLRKVRVVKSKELIDRT